MYIIVTLYIHVTREINYYITCSCEQLLAWMDCMYMYMYVCLKLSWENPHLHVCTLCLCRDIPDGGACQGQCIPEENQGEGHAAAKVFGKVRC